MADDVVVTLKFNTTAAVKQIKDLSQRTRQSIIESLKFNISGKNKAGRLADSLGVKEALNGLQKVNNAFNRFEGNLAGKLNKTRIRGKGAKGGPSKGLAGLFGTVPAGMFGASPDPSLPLRGQSRKVGGVLKKGGELLETDAVTAALKSELRDRKQDNTRTRKDQAELSSARKSQASNIIADVRRRNRLAKVLPAIDKHERDAVAKGQRQELTQRLNTIKNQGRSAQTQQRSIAALEFAQTKKRGALRPGESFRNFLPGDAGGRPRGATSDPGTGGGKNLNTLGISKAATGLLALSSVIGPLNSQLGQVAMSAGFAAFSLGAPVAALSLLSSVLAGFIGVLKKGVAAAKEANLETRAWARSTIQLQVRMRAFLNVIGIKAQRAFGRSVDRLTKMFEQIEKLPWDGLINESARSGSAILELVDILGTLTNAVISTFSNIKKASGFLPPALAFQQLQKSAGLKEDQRIGVVELLRAAINPFFFGELRERMMNGQRSSEGFIFTPKFDIKNVENVGSAIQKSLLKDASKDPRTKALEALNAIQRQALQADEEQVRLLKTLVGEAAGAVPVLR